MQIQRSIFILVLLIPCAFSHAQMKSNQGRLSSSDASQPFYTTRILDTGRVVIRMNNHGYLDFVNMIGVEGAYWPRGGNPYENEILCDQGLGVIGIVNGSTRMSLTQWGSSYSPGPVIDGKPAMYVRPQDSLRYRVYSIHRGDENRGNPDYLQWPADLGAPVDALGSPKVLGDQTLWTVYNGADSSATDLEFSWHAPFPHLSLEVQQTVFAHGATDLDSTQLLANVVFLEYLIINREPFTIDSAYVVFWADVDFNDIKDNVPAVDTVHQIAYCWERQKFPYPRSVGYVLIHGPGVPDPAGTSVYRGRNRAGYRNLPLTAFRSIGDFYTGKENYNSPATTPAELWNMARGFDKLGNPIIDSVTLNATKFPFSGDPVSGNGWINSGVWMGFESGFSFFSGPFSLSPNDTQWVMLALVPTHGSDHFECVRLLRQHADELRSMPYDSLLYATFAHTPFTEPPVPPEATLLQNYPNPFNTTTVITYGNPVRSHITLTVYNTLGQHVMTLIDGDQDPGYHKVTFNGSRLASGVYIYRLRSPGAVQTRKFVLQK